MENFENKLKLTEKTLKNVRGIFDKEDIENKLKDLEKLLSKKIFGKIKT